MDLPFAEVPDYPRRCDAAGMLQRLVEALGFRLRWATEGMRPGDWRARPPGATTDALALLRHIHQLAARAHGACTARGAPRAPDAPAALRAQTLRLLAALAAWCRTAGASDVADLRIGAFPGWHLVNGPLADALTHVGQIALLRRLAGNPVPQHNVFRMSAGG